MKRRHVIGFLVVALLAPHFAMGLPVDRPVEQKPTPPQLVETVSVPAAGAAAAADTTTQSILLDRRQYILEVSPPAGTSGWRYGNANTVPSCGACLADAGWTATNADWSNPTQATRRGLQVSSAYQSKPIGTSPQTQTVVNYGDPSARLNFRSDHRYLIPVTGLGFQAALRLVDDNYSDNDGSLVVRVFRIAQVRFEKTLEQGIFLETPPIAPVVLDYSRVSTTVTIPNPPAAIPVPSATLPGPFGSVEFRWTAGAGACAGGRNLTLYVTVGSTTIPIPLGCYPNLDGVNPALQQTTKVGVGGPTPTQTALTPTGTVSTAPVCEDVLSKGLGLRCGQQASTCELIAPALKTAGFNEEESKKCKVKIFAGEDSHVIIPPGSKLVVLLSWEADRTYLYPFFKDPAALTEMWAPFNPSPNAYAYDGTGRTQMQWFTDEVKAGRLSMTVQLAFVTCLSQAGLCPLPVAPPAVTIPGLGQFMEAMFLSQLAGK